MIFYIFAILFSLYLATKAEKKNNVQYVYWAILVISLISGFRDISVGTDTKHYFRIFNNLANGGTSSLEIGFVYLSRLLLKIFRDSRSLFIIYAFITNYLIVKRLWSLRNYCPFGNMYFLYITIFFPQSMNIIRQYFALAIVFSATKLIEDRKYFGFLLCNLIAANIHMSSIVGIFVLLLWFLIVDQGNKKRKIVLFVSMLILCPIILLLVQVVYTHYIGYLDETYEGFSLLIVGRILILLFFVFVRLVKGNPHRYIEKPTNYTRYISCIYAVGIAISTVGFIYEYVGRIAIYFIIFEIPFASKVSLKEKNGVMKLGYTLLALYFFVIKTLLMHESQVIPYSFYF